MKRKKFRILCVDDEPEMLETLKQTLIQPFQHEYQIETASSGAEGLEVLQESISEGNDIAVIICDHIMPEMRGHEFLAQAHELAPLAPKILLTSQLYVEELVDAVNRAGLYKSLFKPWNAEELVQTVDSALRHYVRNRLTDYDQQLELLKALYLQARLISSSLDSHEISRNFVDAVVTLTGAGRAILIRYREGLAEIETAWFSDAEAQTEFETRCQDHPEALLTETRARINETLTQGFYPKRLAVPLQHSNGRNLGCLLLEHAHHPFAERERELCSLLAFQAATSLEQCALYEDLQQKNQDITDSVHYARRIQMALMPDAQQLTKLDLQSLILYRPRDIVSGDFYWFTRQEDWLFLALVDCTGHGVPGAFMSVLAHAQLKETLEQDGLTDTDAILNRLHHRICQALQQESKKDNERDGLEIALIRLDLASRQHLQFSGAGRPLVRYRNGKYEVFKTDKRDIGFQGLEDLKASTDYTFGRQDLTLKPGDRIYTFTDGVTDQFGGERPSKLGRRRLMTWLEELQHLPLDQQLAPLEQALTEWQCSLPQTDDLLMMGLEL